jgi:hypothetical protein
VKTLTFSALIAGVIGMSAASGELLIRESFDYPSGNVASTPANGTGVTGSWVVGGHGPANTSTNVTFVSGSMALANHFAEVGGSLDVRNARAGNWGPMGASISLAPTLNLGSRPVIWTSALVRVAAPPQDASFFNDWRVEYRLNRVADSPQENSALRVMGRDQNSGSGTNTVSRAAVGADHIVTFQNPGTIQANTSYLFVTRSTVDTNTRSITAITLYVFDQTAYSEYLLAAITNPANAESLLTTHARFTLTDNNVSSGSNTLDDKTVLQFSITGGPVGLFDEIRLGTALGDVVNLGADLYFDLELDSARIGFTSGTVVIRDRYTAMTNMTKLGEFYLELNGMPQVTNIQKSGGLTTITFNHAFEPNTLYNIYLLVPRTNGEIEVFSADLTSYRVPLGLPGAPGSVGTWAIREFTTPLAGNLREAGEIASNAEAGTFVEGTAPILNHSDPDTGSPATKGNFNNDLPVLSNTGGTNTWVVLAKTKLNIPAAGIYTFAVHSDDGFAMRVTGPSGGKFISAHGSGAIDPADEQTIFLNAPTGDSNTRGVYQFDAAGTYDVTYLGWDGGGHGFHEVAWAQGTFPATRDTNTWTLVGNPTHPDVVSIPFQARFVETIPGPLATAGNFSIRTFLGVSGIGGIQAASNFVRDTTRSPADGDNQTIDVLRPTLNARDPEEGQNYLFPAEPFPGDIPGVNDNNILTTAKGRITIPAAGDYTFWVQSDDGFLLRIKGAGGLPNPGFKRVTQGVANEARGTFQMSNPNEMYFDGGTGNTNTRGIIALQAGTYDLEFIQWEGAGGFGYELVAASGAWPHPTTPTNGWFLVGAAAPQITQLTALEIAAPGWTVHSSNADRSEIQSNFNIAGAEAAITNALSEGVGSTTTWDYLDFTDPEAGNQGQFGGNNPWPLNTPNDDNHYAMRATATLVVHTAGTYYLGFQGDDGGYMQIDGPIGGTNTAQWSRIVETLHPAIAALVPGDSGSGLNNRLQVQVGTGNSRTIGAIQLEPGSYTIKTLVYEGGGGSWWEVIGAKDPGIELNPGFIYPLLRKGPEGPFAVPSGIQLVAQAATAGTPPGTYIAVNNFAATGTPVSSVSLTFPSETGRTYRVMASTNLQTWFEVAASVPSAGATTTHLINPTSIPALNGQPKVFFRVVIN